MSSSIMGIALEVAKDEICFDGNGSIHVSNEITRQIYSGGTDVILYPDVSTLFPFRP